MNEIRSTVVMFQKGTIKRVLLKFDLPGTLSLISESIYFMYITAVEGFEMGYTLKAHIEKK